MWINLKKKIVICIQNTEQCGNFKYYKSLAIFSEEKYKKEDIDKITENLNEQEKNKKIKKIFVPEIQLNTKSNPMQRIDMKKYQKPKAKYYADKQVSEMLNALNNEPLILVVMVYLAIDTGLRRSELTGLIWEDVNFETSQISINKQRHYVVGYGTIKDKTKTEAGVRIVTVSNKVMQLLKQYKNQQIQQRLKLGSAWHNEPYVFVLDDGKAISTNLPYKWFINFLKRHNLPKITFHQLRHTNASLLISEGEDIVTVSGRLGHADKNITLNIYSHLIKSREAQVANKMDAFYAKMNVG